MLLLEPLQTANDQHEPAISRPFFRVRSTLVVACLAAARRTMLDRLVPCFDDRTEEFDCCDS